MVSKRPKKSRSGSSDGGAGASRVSIGGFLVDTKIHKGGLLLLMKPPAAKKQGNPMSETTENDPLILTSATGFAAFHDISLPTVKAWIGKGLPCVPGGPGVDGLYDLRQTCPWLAKMLQNPKDRDAIAFPVDTERDREERFLREVGEQLSYHNMRGATLRVLREFPAEASTFLDVALGLVYAKDRTYDPFADPFGGSVAIRFQRTRRYIWCGLGIGFANAVCDLVNGGSMWLVPPELLEFDDDTWQVELPTDGDGDTWDRWVMSMNPDHRGEASTEAVEAVSKPALRLKDLDWVDPQEPVLASLGDWDDLGLTTLGDKNGWLDRVEDRIAELRAEIGPGRRRRGKRN